MRLNRKLTISVLLILVSLGAVMVFDPRLVSVTRETALAVYIYAPTVLFAFIGMIQWRRKCYWPAVAFTTGLLGTGLFHQSVVGMYHGNPGYMFPAGHIFAPIVSVTAYLLSFFVAWLIVKASRRMRGTKPQE